jgi:hypothetical protein
MMADNLFKERLAICYARVYEKMANNFAKGIGTTDCNIFHLSVQFLNRDFYVTQMMENYDFLRVITRSLLSCLESRPMILDSLEAQLSTSTQPVNLAMTSIAFRRYNPIIGDLKVGNFSCFPPHPCLI